MFLFLKSVHKQKLKFSKWSHLVNVEKKAWKRMVTKVCYVPDDFTRKMPKYERFIRPMAMRFKKAHVTHPELKATFCLPII